MDMEYLAHKRNESDGAEQLLIDHLKNTADICSKFAESIGMADYGRVIGMLHDIGKYSESFQKRIRGSKIKTEHSTAGAQEAYKLRLLTAAFCVSGHHGGLPDMGNRKNDSESDATLAAKMKRNLEDYSAWLSEQKGYKSGELTERNTKDFVAYSFFVRFMFSCLTDADFLDTEAFMSSETIKRYGGDNLEQILELFNIYLSEWKKPENKLNKLRDTMLNECIYCGKSRNENLFTLTVPTGGGKTISSLAFALNYGVIRKKKRIIYVIPYTSIIEQNAEVFRSIMGDKNVLENHYNVDFPYYKKDEAEEIKVQKTLACENWDAPVIVTTAVQFFESLYSNKPSKCRKIQNIADSVIVFDEAQMLPIQYLIPCVSAIWQLIQQFNCTAVLCTATQPNLGVFFKDLGSTDIPEICKSAQSVTEDFKRATFHYDGKLEDDELAVRICECEQVLCIVNKKSHAQKLYSLIGESEENYHLSTYMYPEHRKKVLKEIKQRLSDKKPCRVISTSLIECGVDIDFKTVYRAIAGIDSILQAGGRCNRENKHSCSDSIVHIFDTEEIVKNQEINSSVTKDIIEKFGDEIYLPDAIKMYFEKLYYFRNIDNSNKAFDSKKIIENTMKLNFDTVSKNFKLIEDNTVTLYILSSESEESIEDLRKHKYSRELFRKLQKYAINLYKYEFDRLDNVSAIEIIDTYYYVLVNNEYYNDKKGVTFPEGNSGGGIFI